MGNWIQVAPYLAPSAFINKLIAFNGKLYASGSTTKLIEWNGVNAWDGKANAPAGENASAQAMDLCVHAGNLYMITQTTLAGPQSRLYQWNNVNAWSLLANTFGGLELWRLVSFGGSLFATTFTGGLLKWSGAAWSQVAPKYLFEFLLIPVVLAGTLYAVSSGGRLLAWNNVNAWVEVVTATVDAQSPRDAIVDSGIIYAAGDTGNLVKWNGAGVWVTVAPQLSIGGDAQSIMSLAALSGKIYGGTNDLANLFVWNGASAWTQVCPQLGVENNVVLAVLNGVLYGGTIANGNLYQANIPVIPVPSPKLVGSNLNGGAYRVSRRLL